MRVTGLYVYPLKSARGLSLGEAKLDEFGIEGDRRWCLVGDDGRVITQRDCPVLATLDVSPERWRTRAARRGTAVPCGSAVRSPAGKSTPSKCGGIAQEGLTVRR